MKNLTVINSSEVTIEDFVGGMGTNSIQKITAQDLGFDEDIVGYISEADEEGFYYAEYLDTEGYGEYAKSSSIDELQMWLTQNIHKLATGNELITVEKSEIKRVAKEAVQKLKDAPFTKNSNEYVKIIFDGTPNLDIAVMQGNWEYQQTHTVARIEFSHPDYDSEPFMEEVDVEPTEENVRAWNWDNFVEGNDFQNAVEVLENEIIEKLRDLTHAGYDIEIA